MRLKVLLQKIITEVNYRRWLKYESEKLNKFKNVNQGEDCFIIGNGPSLNKMNLKVLNDYYTFGLNKIHLMLERQDFDISYLVSVNKHVVRQSFNEFIKLDCPIFVPYDSINKKKRQKENVNLLGADKTSNLFYRDITEGIREGSTVTFVAMQLAYFMGFNRVFLIGVDHNFKQEGNPHEEQVMEGDDPNHFDPNYFKGQTWQLADLEGSEISYLIAKYSYEKDGRKIYDATIDGKLDIYEKINFDDALKLAKKK
ncbi:MAG: 6-hydroxymethylpterin diphosphokinase MptE-like protein [Bacteroidota bacterium]